MVVKHTKLMVGLCFIVLLMFTASAAIKTFTVEETDFVRIAPQAVDLDGDKINYSYSAPLDERGEWQTGYDDAGEYNINVTASDGKEQTTRTVKIIVNNKNQPPVITEKKITVKETQLVDLKSIISDPDQDALSYTFHEPFDSNGLWQSNYEDSGNFVALFAVSDGEFNVDGRVEIEIINTNQPPEITDTFSSQATITAKEGEELTFSISVQDSDDDKLTYQWNLDNETVSREGDGEYYFGFSSSGKHLLTVTVNDGKTTSSKEWTVKVENTNLPPRIKLLPVTVSEGEKVVLDFPKEDEDGEELAYSFDEPLDSNGEWQTGYDDAGNYKIDVTATDGELETETTVELTVLDIDRAPTINFPELLEINEGESKTWTFSADDPDEDELSLEMDQQVANLIFDLENKTITWQPDYQTIKRSGGLVSNLLNYFRLEHHFLDNKQEKIDLKVCGEELCSITTLKLIVHNVNLAPQFNTIPIISVTETEPIKLDVSAVDPDNDLVRYYFSEPLGKRSGEWDTDFEDRGMYTVYVTATDGQNPTTQPVNIRILKNNRAPTVKVNSDEYTINEQQLLRFQVKTSDPDSDKPSLKLNSLPSGASFKDGIFSWTPDYETIDNKTDSWWNNLVSGNNFLNRKYSGDKETFWLSFTASDEGYDVIHPVKVTVKNINRPPKIIDYLPTTNFKAQVNEPVIFHVAATDEDGDKLTYTWEFRFDQDIIDGTDTIERTFKTVGKKQVKVTVSDGREEAEKEWEIDVEGFVQIQQTRTTLHLQPAVPVKVVPVKVQPVKVVTVPVKTVKVKPIKVVEMQPVKVVNVKPVKTVTVNVKPVKTIYIPVNVQLVDVQPVKTITKFDVPLPEIEPSTNQDEDYLTLRADYIEGIPPVKVHTVKTDSQAVPLSDYQQDNYTLSAYYVEE